MFRKGLEITGHAASVYTIDGINNFVYTGSGDCFAAKWNLDTGRQEKFAIKAEHPIYKVHLLPSENQLILGINDGSIHVIDLENRSEIRFFKQHTQAIFEISSNTNYPYVLISDAAGTVSIWDKKTWDLILYLPFDCGKIRKIRFSQDLSALYLCCQSGELIILDAKTFNETHRFFFHEGGCNDVLILGEQLITCGKDGHLAIYNKIDFTLQKKIPAHYYGIYQLDTLCDERFIVSISRDKTIKIWDSTQFRVVQKIERKHGGHSHAINALYKQNENEFVTVGDDKRIILWRYLNET